MVLRRLAQQADKAIRSLGREGTSAAEKPHDGASAKPADPATGTFAPKPPGALAALRQKLISSKGPSLRDLKRELSDMEEPYFRSQLDAVREFTRTGQLQGTRQGVYDLNHAYTALDEALIKLDQLEEKIRTAPSGLTLGVGRKALLDRTRALWERMLPPGIDHRSIAQVPLHTTRGGAEWQVGTVYSPSSSRIRLGARATQGLAHADGYGSSVARFSGADLELAYRQALAMVGARSDDFPIHPTKDIGNTYAFNYRIGVPKDAAKTKAFHEALTKNLETLTAAFAERGAQGLAEARAALAQGAPPLNLLRHADPYPWSR